MDKEIRKAQLKVLEIFGKYAKSFALAGGTALELYYLRHRFSKDLDFFSNDYKPSEIIELVSAISEGMRSKVELENELKAGNLAKVKFYTMPVRGTPNELKIDFIEDVFFDKPLINRFNKIPVYDARRIYFQKIIALTGTRLAESAAGREITTGRNESRDIVDIYFLSKIIKPLHVFLKGLSGEYQRGMIQWYRSFSRHEFKISYLDLEIYDDKLDAAKIILYLENEIDHFIGQLLA